MSERVREVSDKTFAQEIVNPGKPVLVDFWAEWCGPCLLLAPTIDSIAEEHPNAISVLKLNVDENPETTATFGIKGIPTLILFKGGKELERIVGATAKDTIVRMIARHAKLTSAEKQAA